MIKITFFASCLIALISCNSKPAVEVNDLNDEVPSTPQENVEAMATDETHSRVIRQEDNLDKFIPTNYEILLKEAGDINLDGLEDLILVLKESNEDSRYEDTVNSPLRPVLLLIRDTSGKLQQAKRNDKTVYGIADGGMMGDPFNSITIKNGYFSFEHYGGSSWRWTHIITFKYDKTDNEWYLHKVGGDSFHTLETEKVETKVKSTKDFGKIKFEKFDIFKN